MKILGLDIGDRWTGIAISDALAMLARPLKTVSSHELDTTIQELIESESIGTIVVGYPKTMRGTESEQTKKVKQQAAHLEKAFPKIEWVLWDERLTSQHAAKLKRVKTKEDKLQSHSIAASLLLSSYLNYKRDYS